MYRLINILTEPVNGLLNRVILINIDCIRRYLKYLVVKF